MKKNKFKILQVCNTDFYLNNFLGELVIQLNAKGYEVDCICEGNEISPNLKSYVSKLICFDFPKDSSIFLFIRAIIKMYKIIKMGNYDLVNSHNRNSSIVARLACFLAKKPINVYTAHGFYFHDAQSRFAYRLTLFFERLMTLISDSIMSQSNEDTLLMISLNSSLKKKINTIGNGINIDKFYKSRNRAKVESDLDLASNKIRLICVGRIVKNKGYEDIVRAISEINQELELVIVGGNIKQEINPISIELTELINKLNLNNITITGLIYNVEDYLSVSDIFISASYREGVPRSVLEAQAAFLPVIVTNIRGNREVVTHGVNGYIYEKGNYKELAGFIQVLAKDLDKRLIFGSKGRENVKSRFTENQYVQKQVEIISNLL